MNKTDTRGLTEGDKAIAGIAVASIKESISIESMRKHTQLMKRYSKMSTIPYTLIGLFYVFFAVINSNTDSRDYFINNSNLVTGTVRGDDLFWLELNGWYIFTDGLTKIDVGLVDDTAYQLIETAKALDIYETFFKEDSRIQLFKDNKA